MADLITKLQPLRWRGLDPVPCDAAPFDFSHSQSKRLYPYKDAAGHDWTGRDPVEFSAKLYFLETLQAGAFTQLWNQYRAALIEDGTPGDLVHPLLGSVRCVPLSGSVSLVAQVRSGVIVECKWEETVEDPDTSVVPFETIQIDAGSAAKAAQAAASAVGIDYPTGESETSILDAYDSIKGQIGSAITTVTGKINQVMGAVSSMIEDVNALNDPEAWAAQTSLIAFWNSLNNLKDSVEKKKKATRKQTATAETTIEKFAASVGNSVEDIVNLNPNVLRAPSIAKGTSLTYFSG